MRMFWFEQGNCTEGEVVFESRSFCEKMDGEWNMVDKQLA